MDLAIRDRQGVLSFTQRAVDDGTYEVAGEYDGANVTSGHPMAFRLTFHRIHGMYNSVDREADDVRSCMLISNHFAYSSYVTGWWADAADHNVSFSKSDRFRAYAAASWGCQLPHTDSHERIDFPWTWLWLAVPGIASSPEVSLCLGTARLEAGPLGALYAGVSVMGIDAELVGAMFAYAYHNSSFQLPLLSVASDGYLATFNRSLTRWTDAGDAIGRWHIPLDQEYHVITARYAVTVTIRSQMSSYFRAPVVVEDVHDGRLRLFSDFRACENDAHVRIVRRGRGEEADAVVYAGPAVFNAAEFAYEAPVTGSVESAIRALLPHQPRSAA